MSDGKTRRYMNEREWQCFEDGVKYERERLIKLLELEEDNWRCKEGCCECFGWNGNTPINQVGLLIALIKGKNK